MIIYPAKAEEKLGFDVIRSRLRYYLLSPMGRDRLESAEFSSNAKWVRAELKRVTALQEVLRFDDPVPFFRVGDVREELRAIAPSGAVAEPEMLLNVMRLLEIFRRLRDYFEARSEQYPSLHAVTSDFVVLPRLENRIVEIVEVDGRIKDSASPELRRLRRKMITTQNRLRETLMEELKRSIAQGYTTEAQPTIRSGRMVIPVRAEAKRKIDGFVHDVSSSGQTVYIEPARCLDLNNEVRSIEAEEHHEVRRILSNIADRLRGHISDIQCSSELFGTLDLLQAKAKVANELNAHGTTVNEEGRIHIVNGRNPVLQLHFDALNQSDETQRKVIPLELKLGDDFNTLILTGPNAGGKTVAMKTVGLFAMMIAQGIPLPANEKSDFGVFSALVIDIGDEQSIENDLSTFSSHVSNLRHMIEKADDRTIVLIDEAGTGTDPAKGSALAQVVINALTKAGARTIATTHHGSLKVFAHETEGIENGSMEFDQDTLMPTYRLRMGVPGSSYAFEIASRIGLQPDLLSEARSLLGEQKVRMEDLIANLDARNQALQTRLEEAERALASAREERERYENLFDQLEFQKEEIKEKALSEAESVMQRANAEIERTIREIKEHQAARKQTKQARSALETFKKKISDEKEQIASRKQKRSKKQKEGRKSRKSPVTDTLEVGDQVVLDEGSTTAELLEIEGKEAVILIGSMHMRVNTDRLRKVGGPKKQKVTVKQVDASQSDSLIALKAKQRIDVRGKRVDEALTEVMRFIDEAIATNLNRVEIVHGKGTGALRSAIHEYMERTPDIARYEDAPYNEGGPGVTYGYLA